MDPLDIELPVIDIAATGEMINNLRKEAGLSIRDIQEVMGFSTPMAIYKWIWGKSLPTVDHLAILSALFNTSLDDIVIYY